MKVGSKIQHMKIVNGVRVGGAEEKELRYLSADFAIYHVTSASGVALGERVLRRKEFDNTFEEVGSFFEPDKAYERRVEWSIPAQAADVTERFKVVRVERNGTGKRVAFGHLTVYGYSQVAQWETMDEYDFRAGWQQVSDW